MSVPNLLNLPPGYRPIGLNITTHPAARPGATIIASAGTPAAPTNMPAPQALKDQAAQGFADGLAWYIAHGVKLGVTTTPAQPSTTISVGIPISAPPPTPDLGGVVVPVGPDGGTPPGYTPVPVTKEQTRAFYVHYYVHMADALKA